MQWFCITGSGNIAGVELTMTQRSTGKDKLGLSFTVLGKDLADFTPYVVLDASISYPNYLGSGTH